MPTGRSVLGPRLLRLAVPVALLGLAALLSLATLSLESHTAAGNSLARTVAPIVRYSSRAVLPTECSARLGEARVPVDFTLQRGETLTQVLSRLGLSAAATHQAENTARVPWHSLRAGSRYSAFFNSDLTLAALDLTLGDAGRLAMSRGEDGQWRLDWQPFQRASELRALTGTLDGAHVTLEAALRHAGGPPGLAYRMADALQWDLDFARDLRQGDRFQVLYEALAIDGKDRGVGNLLALVYDNQGRRHEAYRYAGGDVYYDGSGRPLRKMFLRSPLRYTHVTSLFSQHRFHPVLNEYLPHYGVDYSAPVGTPVEVTANGVVVFAGWDGGGGNVVKVQHGSDYVTAYLHLSRFAAGIRPGARVRQGDTIAYTGATGLATGPHLDYRVKLRGNWIDPLTLKGVSDEPLTQSRLASFNAWRDMVRGGLDRGMVPAGLLLVSGGGAADSRLAALATGARAKARAHGGATISTAR
jgi:murein DD-endopeptidase MepM/ murein hydrolase activator NlpD